MGAEAGGWGRPPGEPSDEALAGRVSQRDTAALAALYDRYAQTVYALAAHTLGRADAEEIVQEVFLTLWHKASQFDAARGAFGTWFMAVARHRMLDELRRRSYRQRLLAAEAVDGVLAAAADPAVDVEETAWRHTCGEAVLRALHGLPPEQRRVLVLAYFGGLSHAAMAQHLGWPLGTVKKRVRLGLQKLRLALAPFAPAPGAPTTGEPQARPAAGATISSATLDLAPTTGEPQARPAAAVSDGATVPATMVPAGTPAATPAAASAATATEAG